MLGASPKPWLVGLVGSLCAPYRFRLLTVMLLGLLGSAVTLALPWVAGHFAQNLVEQQFRDLLVMAALVLGLLALDLGIDYATGWLLGTTAHRLLLDLRELLFDRLQRSPLLDVTASTRGELVNLSENDAHVLVGFLVGTLISLLPWLVTFVGAAALMATIDASVTVLAMLALPLFLLLTRLLGRSIRPISARMYARHDESLAQLEENLGLLQLVKARVAEATERERYAARLAASYAENRARLRLQLLLAPLTQFAGAASMMVALLVATAVGPEREIAELVSLLLYGFVLYGPVTGLAGVYGSLQSARASVDRLERVLTRPVESPEAGEPLAVTEAPAIAFESVDFAYVPEHDVLVGLSLQIAAGEFVVITGPNGVGKSTLALLLGRYVEPRAGRVTLAGTDIGAARLGDLRRSIGLVYQGMPLLDRSIRENLHYGSDAELDPASLDATGLLDFVAELDGGLDFRVGPAGNRLSGGQRQRVALAAVLLQARPVMVLDEATSMLDEPCQRRVRAHIAALSDITRIVIDHDPSSWEGARIIRL